MLPSQFLNLEKHEKAFVVAAIEIKMESDEKEKKKIKKTKK
jgi:hypothetical protein